MVTDSLRDLSTALSRILRQGNDGGSLTCPTCNLGNLSEDEMHCHHPMYHAAEANHSGICPVCNRRVSNVAQHLHNDHGPLEEREPRAVNPEFAAFAWVVCRRRDGKFLLVNEPAGICRTGLPGYWLPAGRVDAGESLLAAAARETLEEGGVEVRIEGVLRFMFECEETPRIVFLASPVDEDAAPKSVPDWESAGALWVHVRDLGALRAENYRAPDPAELFPAVASGTLPCQALDTESFRELDLAVQELTSNGTQSLQRLRSAWKALQREYPPHMFTR